MSQKHLYNNIGMAALGIAFVASKANPLSLSKALLILPFITHKELLNYLSKSNVKAQGLEKLIIEKAIYFSNFNRRYYDSLCISLNAIQLLNELEIAQVQNSFISVDPQFTYHEAMGLRAKKAYKASTNIALVLNDNVDKLYLNLRIEL